MPKTGDTRRHCEVELTVCPQPPPTSRFLGVAEDCCILSTLPRSAFLCMRYIDDLLALNNMSFACKTGDIYPRELILKKTTGCPTMLAYLDVLDNGRYSSTIFYKREF